MPTRQLPAQQLAEAAVTVTLLDRMQGLPIVVQLALSRAGLQALQFCHLVGEGHNRGFATGGDDRLTQRRLALFDSPRSRDPE